MKYELYYRGGMKETFLSREEALLAFIRNIDYFYDRLRRGDRQVFKFVFTVFKKKDISDEYVDILIKYYKRFEKRVEYPLESLLDSKALDDNYF